MKKVISVSVDEGVLSMGQDAAYEMRVSFSSFVEGAIKASVGNLLSDLKEDQNLESVADRIRSRLAEDLVGEVDLVAENEKLMEKRKAVESTKGKIRPYSEVMNQFGQVRKSMLKASWKRGER